MFQHTQPQPLQGISDDPFLPPLDQDAEVDFDDEKFAALLQNAINDTPTYSPAGSDVFNPLLEFGLDDGFSSGNPTNNSGCSTPLFPDDYSVSPVETPPPPAYPDPTHACAPRPYPLLDDPSPVSNPKPPMPTYPEQSPFLRPATTRAYTSTPQPYDQSFHERNVRMNQSSSRRRSQSEPPVHHMQQEAPTFFRTCLDSRGGGGVSIGSKRGRQGQSKGLREQLLRQEFGNASPNSVPIGVQIRRSGRHMMHPRTCSPQSVPGTSVLSGNPRFVHMSQEQKKRLSPRVIEIGAMEVFRRNGVEMTHSESKNLDKEDDGSKTPRGKLMGLVDEMEDGLRKQLANCGDAVKACETIREALAKKGEDWAAKMSPKINVSNLVAPSKVFADDESMKIDLGSERNEEYEQWWSEGDADSK